MVFNAITNAGAGVLNATIAGVVNILQSAAATDVGTILVVAGILIVGKAILDKVSEKK